MIAVADTSPLCYLVLIGEIELLPKLFTRVLVPQAVILELRHKNSPAAVRAWASNTPAWISIEQAPDAAFSYVEKLNAGERAAIYIAESVDADSLIVDEKIARTFAEQRDLPIIGILGILGEASTVRLVNLTDAISRLRRTSFRYSDALVKSTLERYSTQQ